MSVAGVVLAAGFSRRLGRPKQTLVLGGESLLARTLRVAREAELQPLLAVVRPQAEFSTTLPPLCEIVFNEEAEEGIGASIRVGVRHLQGKPDVEGAVLLTCDQVLLAATHLSALSARRTQVTASAYAQKQGVPAYFPREYFPDLLALRGDKGARDLLVNAHAIQAEALALDIDTEEDMARALEYLRLNPALDPRGQ